MLDFGFLNRRPIVIALAGSNGAGKSTFFSSHLAGCGLRFVNADEIAKQLAIGPYEAAEAAAAIRAALVQCKESFVFET
jgi:predicted ABC-type ATPase